MIRRIAIKVDYVDGRVEHLLCTGADTIVFERTYDRSTQQIGERLEYMWFIAWANLRRTKKITLDFEAWMGIVEQVSDDDEAGTTEILPLESTPSTGSSATSPTSTGSPLP